MLQLVIHIHGLMVFYTNSNDTSSYTYQTTNGCDSIVQLDLTILSSK